MSHAATLPLVSAIMPVYNREDFIEEAIKSVFHQTFDNFELIVADDGSVDGTKNIVSRYLNDRCFYYNLPHCGNISRLRNFGLQKAKGKYIAYLDSDDAWYPEKLKEQIQCLEENETIGLVFTGIEEFEADLILKQDCYDHRALHQRISFKDLLNNKLTIYPSSILYRKDCLTRTSLHDELFLWNDMGFITRLAAHHGAIKINKTLTRIRKHESNISTVLRKEAVGYRDMITTIGLLHHEKLITNKEYIDMSARFCYNMAGMLTQLKDYEKAKQAYRQALTFKPTSIKAWIRFGLNNFHALFFHA